MRWFGWAGWLHVMFLVVFDSLGDMSVRCVSQWWVLILTRGAHPLLVLGYLWCIRLDWELCTSFRGGVRYIGIGGSLVHGGDLMCGWFSHCVASTCFSSSVGFVLSSRFWRLLGG